MTLGYDIELMIKDETDHRIVARANLIKKGIRQLA